MFHNVLTTIAAAALMTATLAPQAPAGSCQYGSKAGHETRATNASATKANIVETAKAAGAFKTLLAAAHAAGLVETLAGDGPLTVFAPTDEAFNRLPDGTIEALLADTDKLAAILTYHVVPGAVTASEVVTMDKAATVNGADLTISMRSGDVFIQDSKVLQTDILCENGVIHVIDQVMISN